MKVDAKIAREIAREHGLVNRAIKGIRTEIARLRGEAGPGHEVGELRRLFETFTGHLKRHFELEEKSGFLADYPEPGTQRLVEELLGQHRSLERGLAALSEALTRADEGKACLSDECALQLEVFLSDLHSHEHAENALLQQIVYTEIGGGD